jgi:hypothetical protein
MLSNLFDDDLVTFKISACVPRYGPNGFSWYGRWFSCVGQEENSSVRGIRKKVVRTVLVSWGPQKDWWDYAYLVGTTGRTSVSQSNRACFWLVITGRDVWGAWARVGTRGGARGLVRRARGTRGGLAGVSARWWFVGPLDSGDKSSPRVMNNTYIYTHTSPLIS